MPFIHLRINRYRAIILALKRIVELSTGALTIHIESIMDSLRMFSLTLFNLQGTTASKGGTLFYHFALAAVNAFFTFSQKRSTKIPSTRTLVNTFFRFSHFFAPFTTLTRVCLGILRLD